MPSRQQWMEILTMWDLRPLAIMENKINIKVSLLWTVLLSPKIFFQRTSDLRYLLCVLGMLAAGLTISSLLSMPAICYDFPLSLPSNWYLLCFTNTLPRSSCWHVIRVLNCPPTLLLPFKNKQNKQTEPENPTLFSGFFRVQFCTRVSLPIQES